MTSTTKALIAAGVAVAFAVGLIVWQMKSKRGEVNLTAEDLALIAADLPPQDRAQLASSESARKDFAKDMREVLAVAAEAKANGFADKPEIKHRLDIMRSFVIAQYYVKSQQGTQGARVTEAEIEAFFGQPGNQQRVDQAVKDLQATPQILGSQSSEQELRREFGEQFIGEKKGRDAGIDQKRPVQLQMRFQEAVLLEKAYIDELMRNATVSDQEIDAYIANHPALDRTKLHALAENVLKRARAGEDFAKLAQEFSAAQNKNRGGDLGWFGHGKIPPDLEEAAFALKPGQISDIVQTNFGFVIIKVEERRTEKQEGKPQEQVHARHILITDVIVDSSGRPKSGRDRAREAIALEKQKRIIDEIVARSHVKVADNFQVAMPAAQ